MRIHRKTFKLKEMKLTTKTALGVLFFYCLVLMPAAVWGQDPSIPSDPDITVIVDENKTLKQELDMNDLNRITLLQMGQSNRATIQQLSGNYDPNLAKISQVGDENIAFLLQAGQHNASEIDQFGEGNMFLGIHTGENIINTVHQTGKGHGFLYCTEWQWPHIEPIAGRRRNRLQSHPDRQ